MNYRYKSYKVHKKSLFHQQTYQEMPATQKEENKNLETDIYKVQIPMVMVTDASVTWLVSLTWIPYPVFSNPYIFTAEHMKI